MTVRWMLLHRLIGGSWEEIMAPLTGIRVVEVTGEQGLYCGKILADLGADVWTVEPPKGHPARFVPPFSFKGESLYFKYYATNRRMLPLDIEVDGRTKDFTRLLESSDLLILAALDHNISEIAATITAYLARPPHCIEISGLGPGHENEEPTPEIVAFASGGLMNISGDPSFPPVVAPGQQGWDLTGAVGAAVALTLLQAHVPTKALLSVYEFMATLEHNISIYANESRVVARSGSQHQVASPGKLYACKDGWVHLFVTSSSPGVWDRFFDWLGRPETLADEHWRDGRFRRAHSDCVDSIVTNVLQHQTVHDVATSLQKLKIPCVPVHSIKSFYNDPHITDRHWFQSIDPGRWAFPGLPYRLSAFSSPVFREPTNVGQRPPTFAPKRRTSVPNGDVAIKSSLPLANVRILDFSHMIAGPYATLLLGYLGAEVIKVESTHRMDGFRLREGGHPEKSRPFCDFNRNKLGVTINLKHPEGIRLVRELVKRSDIVIENFSAQIFSQLGLTYEEMKSVRKDIIMVSIQGMGQTGPYRDWVCWGPSVQWFSGLGYLWNHPEIPLVGSQTSYPDYVAAVHAAIATLAALWQRNTTGEGQWVEVSMVETTAAMLGPYFLEYLVDGREPQPYGNSSPRFSPYGCYPSREYDRWCVIAVMSEQQWQALVAVPGLEPLSTDPRFVTNALRMSNRTSLDNVLAHWTREHHLEEIIYQMRSVGVPCGKVANGEDLYHDHELWNRKFLVPVEHSFFGRKIFPGPPFILNGQRPATRAAPMLGQHNTDVFRTLLGLSDPELHNLMAIGALE